MAKMPQATTIAPVGPITVGLGQAVDVIGQYSENGDDPSNPDVHTTNMVWLQVGVGQFGSKSNVEPNTPYSRSWVATQLGAAQIQVITYYSSSGTPLTPYPSPVLSVNVINVRAVGDADLPPREADVDLPAREGDVVLPSRKGDATLED